MRKTRAYREDIGKYYNMTNQIFEDEHYYVCHDGRELRHIRTETKEQDGYTQTFEVYGCADCSGCEHKAKCLYKYNPEKDADKNKIMKINEQWEELKAASHANIESEKGIAKVLEMDYRKISRRVLTDFKKYVDEFNEQAFVELLKG